MPSEVAATSTRSHPNLLSHPPEIVLEIYSWATFHRYYNVDTTYLEPRGTLLSHICRPLRSLAISSQSLWDAVPVYRSPSWTEVCLARASTAPLHIDLKAYHDDKEHLNANTLVLPHLSRAKYLRLDVEFNYTSVNDELTRIFEALTSSSMPFLETLDICFDTIDFDDRQYSCIYLPQPLFNGVPPMQLKHLRLRQAGTMRSNLPATMPVSAFSSDLRSLDLYNSRLWENVDEMVQFFQTVPLLENLEYTLTRWDSHLFDTSPSQTYPPRCVRMKHLETFITMEHAQFSAAMAVFTYLALPSHATLIIDLDPDDDHWIGGHHAHFASYLTLGTQAMHEHFAGAIAAGEHYDRLHIEKHTLSPQNFDDEVAPARLLHHLPEPSCLRFDMPIIEENLHSQACAMYLSLPIFAQVTQLSVTDLTNFDIWVALGQYKDVHSLFLRKDALPSFVMFNALPPAEGHFLFPALDEIHIADYDFSLKRLDEGSSFTITLEIAFGQYVGPGKRTVVYVDRQTCAGAQPVVNWLQEMFGEDSIVFDPVPDEEWPADE
ncbi:hypothetical protein PENSPDRAFT_651611 [Peniophora sp. CONT]|nr:hypothetical protein PENSPDRAFT_651611 [Peniophora sp. CONT]